MVQPCPTDKRNTFTRPCKGLCFWRRPAAEPQKLFPEVCSVPPRTVCCSSEPGQRKAFGTQCLAPLSPRAPATAAVPSGDRIPGERITRSGGKKHHGRSDAQRDQKRSANGVSGRGSVDGEVNVNDLSDFLTLSAAFCFFLWPPCHCIGPLKCLFRFERDLHLNMHRAPLASTLASTLSCSLRYWSESRCSRCTRLGSKHPPRRTLHASVFRTLQVSWQESANR